MNRLRGSLRHLIYNIRELVAASGTRFPKIRTRRNGRRALVAASGTRFPKIRVRASGKTNERSHFEKGVMFLGSSSRLVHLPGKKAPDLLHGVFSLSEVRLENLTPSWLVKT